MKESAVLFGHGNLFERKIDSLKGKYDILEILDNAIDGNETDSETGMAIRRPGRVKELHPDKVVILSYAIGDMTNQMVSLGVEQDRIVYGLFESPRNSFEEMLYDAGNGELILEDDGLWYKNNRIDWSAKVDDKDIRSINKDIKSTALYPETKKLISSLPVHPIDDDYGLNRGTPVDRYYIEKFLDENSNLIKGRILEVGGRDYSLRFGGERVTGSDVIHKKISDPDKRIFIGDLATGEGVPEEIYDCFICTQTLPFIYDIKSAAGNIVKTLKSGGSALVTAGGISQIITNDRRRYGHYWSFTDMSMENLFSDIEGVSKVKTFTYGNVKSAAAFLYGLSWEELGREALDIYDSEYQVIVAATVEKK